MCSIDSDIIDMLKKQPSDILALLPFRYLFVPVVLLTLFNCNGQVQASNIKLFKIQFESYNVNEVTSENADHALRIASFIFNSKEFQDSLSKRDFTFHNICHECDSNDEEGKPRISGNDVLDNLFKKRESGLSLTLRKVGKHPLFGICFGLGFTCPRTDKITSNYKNIKCDMDKLPFDYAYGVHLAHEYMHNIGYCHTDHVDDVAEATGWIAYYFVVKWFKNGVRIN